MSADQVVQPKRTAHVAVLAGELSGDWIAATVLAGAQQESERQGIALSFEGVLGPRLRALGGHPLGSIDQLSLRGYVEVLKHLPRLWWWRRSLIQHWLQQPPALFLGVDAPDFNLTIAERLRSQGIPTVQLVCPAFWAWRQERVHQIRRACDHVLCVFPFEPALLAQHDIPATFIGHPLASLIPAEHDELAARGRLGLSMEASATDNPLVALLPGSRVSEIESLGPLMIETARLLQQRYPRWRFVTPLASGAAGQAFERCLQQHWPDLRAEQWLRVPGDSHTVMAAADLIVVASGTATLEAALHHKPMVITYRVPWLTLWLMARKAGATAAQRRGEVDRPPIGLPNILLGERVVPELLQEAATPSGLAAALEPLWFDQALRARTVAALKRLHGQLARPSGALAWPVLQPWLEK